MYVGSHLDHHRTASYGTSEDPEYEPIAHWPAWRIALSSLTLLAVPGLLVLRWAVLGPLSRLVPALRPTVVESMSTLVINPGYRRRAPQGSDARRWAREEAAAAAVAWAGIAAVATGAVTLRQASLWYALTASIAVLNHVRTLAAHRYESRGARLDAAQQLMDSVNVVGSGWLTALAAPVGLRYHALHHLAPTLPYHSLGAVHRRLVAELPQDAPYRRAESEGILASARALFRRAGDAETVLPPARSG
jgi:fatty acid desaturase